MINNEVFPLAEREVQTHIVVRKSSSGESYTGITAEKERKRKV
jgi:hypothetical protein